VHFIASAPKTLVTSLSTTVYHNHMGKLAIIEAQIFNVQALGGLDSRFCFTDSVEINKTTKQSK